MAEEEIVARLKELGLTSYEARCYIALAKLGPSDPRRVASDARIPYPNAYESLSRLVGRGWVEIVRKRPAVYRARRPKAIEEQVVSELGGTFESLEKLYRATPVSDTELVYTIRDKKNVVSKIFELISDAKESIMLVGPSRSLRLLQLEHSLNDAMGRGVTVRMVSDSGLESAPAGVQLRTGNLLAFDLLVDSRVALIALPDFGACGWVDSPAVAAHLMQFLELLWEASHTVKVVQKPKYHPPKSN